jgi:ribose transport system ATP-binding protein
VQGGEIVALAGLVGSGRSELVETLFGVRGGLAGEVRVDGQAIRLGSPQGAMRAGLVLVPEDRKQTGLFVENSVRENLTIAALTDAASAPLTSRRWERQVSQQLIERLHVKTADQETVVANLSGGNQQKVALGKWLLREPGVLILDEPTRGVDIGAKHEIYELMEQLAAQGVAILFVSSELEEVIGMADRVLVMHDGAIAGELPRAGLSEEAIMQLAVGGQVPAAPP